MSYLLKQGSRGNDVIAVQHALNAAREYVTEMSSDAPLELDGMFGQLTDKATRKLQKAFNLGVDGIVGPKTMWQLFEPGRARTTLEGQRMGGGRPVRSSIRQGGPVRSDPKTPKPSTPDASAASVGLFSKYNATQGWLAGGHPRGPLLVPRLELGLPESPRMNLAGFELNGFQPDRISSPTGQGSLQRTYTGGRAYAFKTEFELETEDFKKFELGWTFEIIQPRFKPFLSPTVKFAEDNGIWKATASISIKPFGEHEWNWGAGFGLSITPTISSSFTAPVVLGQSGSDIKTFAGLKGGLFFKRPINNNTGEFELSIGGKLGGVGFMTFDGSSVTGGMKFANPIPSLSMAVTF